MTDLKNIPSVSVNYAQNGASTKSNELGMKTFDQALFDLYEADKISYDDALRSADSMNELRLRIKLEGKAAKGKDQKDDL